MPALFYRGLSLLRPLSLTALAFSLLVAGSCVPWSGSTELSAGDLLLAVDAHGRIVRMVDENTGRDYSADAVDSPLLSLQIDSILQPPQRFGWNQAEGIATLSYAGDVTALVQVTPKQTHLVFELLSVHPIDRIESGRHAVSLNSSLKPDQDARARLELRPSGETERVAANVGDGGQTREE